MQNIIFLDEEIILSAEVKRIGERLVQINGDFDKNVSGFHVVTDSGDVYGKYEDYTTLYKEIEGGFILSNDESVYVEPDPIPDPEPYEPTLEEVQEAKVAEMNTAQQHTIEAGIDVTLADGIVEHFTLTQYDQQSLMGLQSQVATGEDNIPWHNSNEKEHCKFYSNADMQLIVTKAMEFVTYNVTYYRDLRIYIRALTDKEAVKAITYGAEVPADYQSDVLKVLKVGA